MSHIYNKSWSEVSTQMGGAKALMIAARSVWYQYLCRSKQRGAMGPPTGSSILERDSLKSSASCFENNSWNWKDFVYSRNGVSSRNL